MNGSVFTLNKNSFMEIIKILHKAIFIIKTIP